MTPRNVPCGLLCCLKLGSSRVQTKHILKSHFSSRFPDTRFCLLMHLFWDRVGLRIRLVQGFTSELLRRRGGDAAKQLHSVLFFFFFSLLSVPHPAHTGVPPTGHLPTLGSSHSFLMIRHVLNSWTVIGAICLMLRCSLKSSNDASGGTVFPQTTDQQL